MSSEQTTTRSKNWPLYLMGALFTLGVMAVIAWNVELPYLAYSAGPVSDAADTVFTDEVDTYPPEGELLMLTVVSQDVNIFEAVIAGFDPTIDLVEKQKVRRQGETDEEYRNRTLQQMDDSNFRSITVALIELGYEMVPIEVVVNDLVEGVPASDVIELGDTIKAVNGFDITAIEDFGPAMEGLEVGDVIAVTVVRGDETFDLEVELAPREDDPETPMIGIVLGELTEPPFDIEIESGDVGGPSAGMMHTLAIIDTLTEGELTAGRVIAGTGTIRVDGTIGNIGGIRQKVVGAEAAGAEYILVPRGNYESALTAERESIEIIPIDTLQDALEFLRSLASA